MNIRPFQCYIEYISSFNSTSKRMSLYLPLLFTILLEPRHCNKRYKKSICRNTSHLLFSFPRSKLFLLLLRSVLWSDIISSYVPSLIILWRTNKPSLYFSLSLYLLYFILESYLKCNIFLYHIFLPIKHKLLEVRECLLDSP